MPLTGFGAPAQGTSMGSPGATLGTNQVAPFANLGFSASVSPSGISSSTQYAAGWIAIIAILLVLYVMAVD